MSPRQCTLRAPLLAPVDPNQRRQDLPAPGLSLSGRPRPALRKPVKLWSQLCYPAKRSYAAPASAMRFSEGGGGSKA